MQYIMRVYLAEKYLFLSLTNDVYILIYHRATQTIVYHTEDRENTKSKIRNIRYEALRTNISPAPQRYPYRNRTKVSEPQHYTQMKNSTPILLPAFSHYTIPGRQPFSPYGHDNNAQTDETKKYNKKIFRGFYFLG